MLPTVQVCRAFFTVPCDGLIQIKGVPCDGLIQIKSRFQPLSFASFVERAWDRGWKIYRGSRNSRSCDAVDNPSGFTRILILYENIDATCIGMLCAEEPRYYLSNFLISSLNLNITWIEF